MPEMPTFVCYSFEDCLALIFQWFKWVISLLNHFIIIPRLNLSLLDLFIAIIIVGLVFDAIFVVFDNALPDAVD